MNIPFKVKLLTDTAKAPAKENQGDLWDIYADDFCGEYLKDLHHKEEAMYNYDITHKQTLLSYDDHLDCFDRNHLPDGLPNECKLYSKGRILVKTGISIELPKQYQVSVTNTSKLCDKWFFKEPKSDIGFFNLKSYAVADLRPRSGLALKHGITVLNTPGTIDNSYRKEIGVILYNAGHEPYTITKGDKIAQMLIRPLYPSKMEIVKSIEDTQRGGYGSTGK